MVSRTSVALVLLLLTMPLKKPAAAMKRPAAVKKEASQYSMCSREVHDGEALSREQFLQKLHAWAASTRREHVKIRAKKNEWRRNGTSFYYTFRCCACVDCGWSGVATYNRNTKEVVFRAKALDTHGSAAKAWGSTGKTGKKAGLTYNVKNLITDFMREHVGQVRLQQVMQVFNSANLESIPKETQVRAYMKNLRNRDASLRWAGDSSRSTWNMADFQLLLQSLPKLGSLGGHLDENLVVAGSYLDEHLTVTLCCPRLVQSTWNRVANKEYLKICADAVYKTTDAPCQFAVVSVGLLVKNSGSSKGRENYYTFPTSFAELCLAICASEHAICFERLFTDLSRTMQELCGVQDFNNLVCQVHGDMAGGLEAARKKIFPKSIRCSDYSHVLGLCRSKTVNGDEMWRKGLVTNCRQAALVRQHADIVEAYAHGLRAAPGRVFSALWRKLLTFLQMQNEVEVVKVLTAHYLSEDKQSGVIGASWRGSPDYLQPGSYCGSQPQESFHKNRLRPGLNGLRQPLSDLVKQLSLFFQSRANEATQLTGALCDVPCHAWSPSYRASAQLYLASGKYLAEKDNLGNLYVGMRTNPDSLAHEKTPLTPHVFHCLLHLMAGAGADVEDMLEKLGCKFDVAEALLNFLHVVERWCLVVVGPAAQRFWRATNSEESTHLFSICWNCKEYATYGACPHTYVGMSVAGLLDESAPWDKKRGKVPKTNRHTNLSPQKTEAAVPPPVLHVRAVSDGQHALSKRLKQLLQKHNMMGYADLLLRHQLDEEEIALWSLPDLLQLLKSPAKATREFLAELKSQQEVPEAANVGAAASSSSCQEVKASPPSAKSARTQESYQRLGVAGLAWRPEK